MILPYVSNIGSTSFRRWFIRLLPSKNIELLTEATDIMWETSNKIFYGKKAALEREDDAVVHQIGEKRDIMSILSKSWTKIE